VLFAVLLGVAGCGDGEGSTGPTPGSLSVVPGAELLAEAGGERLFQARLEDADGNLSLVTDATWSTSDPSVATSLGGGRFRAAGAGTTVVAAEADGLRATATLEVYLADPVEEWTAGETYTGRQDYAEYIPGTLPVVVSAPHGGLLEPDEIPDRAFGVMATDLETQDLARRIRAALLDRLGAAPHLVISRLDRSKLDPNRSIEEAAQDDPFAEHAWQEYHAFVDTARALVTRGYGSGLYLDIHGHGHPVDRVELGYLLSADELGRSDEELASGSLAAESSVRALVASSGASLTEVVRGEQSLGALLQARGVRAVPSPSEPDPAGEPYFTGGYSTRRHGSRDGGTVSGIQLEHHFDGLRDTPENRTTYAGVLASAVEVFLRQWYPGLLPDG